MLSSDYNQTGKFVQDFLLYLYRGLRTIILNFRPSRSLLGWNETKSQLFIVLNQIWSWSIFDGRGTKTDILIPQSLWLLPIHAAIILVRFAIEKLNCPLVCRTSRDSLQCCDLQSCLLVAIIGRLSETVYISSRGPSFHHADRQMMAIF